MSIDSSIVVYIFRVFFEGIVDAKPNPKFEWYFNDQPIIPGNKKSAIQYITVQYCAVQDSLYAYVYINTTNFTTDKKVSQ